MRRNVLVFLLVVVSLLLLAACAQQAATPQVIRETVVVTQVVEQEKVVTQVVEKEKVVTQVVEVTPVAGRCAPTSFDELGDNPIKIGVPIPLSAPGSVTGGRAMQTAVNIAVKEVNDAGGVLGKYPVDVVFYDTSGLPERGTAGMEYLITSECVVAVIGEYHSAAGLAEKEVANKYHVPVIFAETWNDQITASQYPEVFRIAPTVSLTALKDAEYLRDVGVSFVAIVAENTDYGVPAAERTTKFLSKLNIDSETYLAEQGTQEFGALIAKIEEDMKDKEGLKAVLVLITGETSYNFEQQASEQGLMPREDVVGIANQVAYNSDEFWQNVPDGNYYAFRRVGVVPALTKDNPVATKFVEAYKNELGRFPESYAFEAYDAFMLMIKAIEKANSLDPDAIIAALESFDSRENGVQLAQGVYYFPYGTKNPVPDDQPEWMWHQWPDPAVFFLQYWKEGQSAEEACVVWPKQYQTCGDVYWIQPGTEPPVTP